MLRFKVVSTHPHEIVKDDNEFLRGGTSMKINVTVAILMLLGIAACQHRSPQTSAIRIDSTQLAQFAPLPDSMGAVGNPITQAKVDLGRMLFYETRLSRDHDLSCNSCHSLTA